MGCESSTGYLVNFIFYTGASTDYGNCTLRLQKLFESYKSLSKIVITLLQDYMNTGYIVKLDNYYYSSELAETLSL